MKRIEVKTCQCGARPRWVQLRHSRKPGRRSSASPELLECQACGNAAGPSSSREQLATEWNASGWCGQSQPAEDYRPFGKAWIDQCMRIKKRHLVEILETASRRGLALDALVAKLRGELGEQDRLIAKLRIRRAKAELATVIDRLVERGVIQRGTADIAKRRIMNGGGK